MKSPLSSLSVCFVSNFLNGIDIDAATRDRITRLAGIPITLLDNQSDTRVTEEQFATLYRLLAECLDDEMPGLFSRPMRPGTTKFLCRSLLDAPYLQVALHRYVRFHHMMFDDFTYELKREPELTRLAIVPISGHAPQLTAFGQQLMFKFVHGITSWLIGKTIPVVKMHFAFPEPGDIGEYRCLHPGPVFFDQPQSVLYFPSAIMDSPLVHRTKHDVRTFLARAPEGWISETLTEPTVTNRVREYLESHFQKSNDIESVAQALLFSVRTLCRRLESEGTTFRLVKDELRRDIAIQRLTKTSRSVAAIAFELGFEDSTAFHRAFKQWTGSTPGAYRRNPHEARATPELPALSTEELLVESEDAVL